jgi:hypothetical protein
MKWCFFQVQILYSDDSLNEKIEISVKRIEILKENPNTLDTNSDVDNYLTNFCKVFCFLAFLLTNFILSFQSSHHLLCVTFVFPFNLI